MSQRPLAHAGLQVRLVAFVSILLFAMVAALIVTDAANLSRTARGYMTDRATSTISLLGESMVEPLDNLSVGRLRRLASDTRRDPDVRYVYVLDHEGRVLTDGTVDNPHRHAILTDPTSQAAAASATTLVEWTDGLLAVAQPIYLAGSRLGTVRLGYSTQRIDEDTTAGLTRDLVVGGIFLVLGILAVLWISGKITGPLRLLTRKTVDLAAGDFQGKIDVPEVRELRVLTAAFNQMIDNLRSMRLAKAFDDSIINSIIDSIVVVSPEGRIDSVNAATCELLGYEASDLIGVDAATILADGQPLPTDCTADEPGARSRQDRLYRAKDGRDVPVLVSALSKHAANGAPCGNVWVALDLTEQKRAERILEHQARHDALCGLPNRVLLQERLCTALQVEHGPPSRMALLLIDLDRFKDVNDTYGHHAGDRLLQQVAQRVQGSLRPSDTVARLGGDEFAVLLPGANAAGALACTLRLLTALDEPFDVEGLHLPMRASIGIAICPEHGEDAETLLRRADVAMYVAKRNGGGHAVYSQEQDSNTPERLALLGDLRSAVICAQLALHFQPIVDLHAGRVARLEALIRWHHPVHGLVMPDDFIPLAEQAGVIGAITRWAVGEAVRHSRLLHDEGIPIPVAVNLSARDLLDPDLPPAIAGLLADAGLGPECLMLELTESAVMSDSQRALETLECLHGLGIRLAIDDFGTGYSSLGHLKRLPVDEIKIDKSFVLDMTGDDNDLAIVRTTIDLGHNLGKRVVAEGVETEAAWAMLANLDCDLAQGYFISSAVPAGQIVDWLRASPWGLSPGAPPPIAEQPAPTASPKRRRSSRASGDPAAA